MEISSQLELNRIVELCPQKKDVKREKKNWFKFMKVQLEKREGET